MIFSKQEKAWSVTAITPYTVISTVVCAETLPKAFKKFSKDWHMDDVLEISIKEVTGDERSEGISGADQAV